MLYRMILFIYLFIYLFVYLFIYFAHVRYSVHIKRIESIQKKFCLYASRNQYMCRFPNVIPPYKLRCEALNM